MDEVWEYLAALRRMVKRVALESLERLEAQRAEIEALRRRVAELERALAEAKALERAA